MIGQFDRRGILLAAAASLAAAPTAGAMMTPARRAQSRGFDFLLGRWDVRHRQLRERLASSRDWFEFPGTLEVSPILGGGCNFDRNVLMHPKGVYEAHSLRLFNQSSGLWSIWWLDSRAPNVDAPVVGGFRGAKGSFFSEETFNERPIRVRTTYQPLSTSTAQWTQAFSPDGGTSWEVNWIMDFRRPA